MLHGRAANAETILSVEGLLDPSYHIISIRGTYISPKGEYEWFLPYDYDHPLDSFTEEHFKSSEDILTTTISHVLGEKDLLRRDLYFMGFSQGAAMCYILALRGMIKPKGVIPMSGFFPRPIERWEQINKTSSFLITHGSKDEVLPTSESIHAQHHLQSKGISSQYYEYKGRHKMTLQLLEYVNSWIKSGNTINS